MEKPMIEENNASSGAVESSAQQSQAEAKPAQSELTAQDILAASTVQTELSAGNQDTGKSRWYIVHTYSGFEQRVEATIKEMMRNAQDNGLIHEVVFRPKRSSNWAKAVPSVPPRVSFIPVTSCSA